MQNYKIVLVTKNRAVSEILDVLRKTGITRVAENRPDEAEIKFQELPSCLEKHFIGKLQSRKIKKIVELFDVIQSLENISQAEKIDSIGKKIKVMIQVNISGLPRRSGLSPDKFKNLLEQVQKLKNLDVIGVMGMASANLAMAAPEFKRLKSLQGSLPECSMGMSDDYPIAIQEGATMLRLGRIMFEENLPQTLKYE